MVEEDKEEKKKKKKKEWTRRIEKERRLIGLRGKRMQNSYMCPPIDFYILTTLSSTWFAAGWQ